MSQDSSANELNPYRAPESDISQSPATSNHGKPNPNAKIRFQLIPEAWSLVKARMSTWLLISLIMTLVSFGWTFTLYFGVQKILVSTGTPSQLHWGMRSTSLLIYLGVQVGQTVLSAAVSSFFVAGMFRTAIHQVRGIPIDAGGVFQASDVWMSSFLAMLLKEVAVYCGLLLLIIPALLVMGRPVLVLPLIADARLGPRQAFASSWKVLRGQGLSAFAFYFLASLASGIGVCGCGIGILFTWPIIYLSIALLYRDFFLADPTPDPVWIESRFGPAD